MARQAATADRNWIGDLASLAVIGALFSGVYLLPPDTSLAQVREAGSLRACVPADYPPLAFPEGNEKPGVEIELLQAVAERLGVRLVLSPNAAIGRELDPRSWQVSRAACQILAGGIVANEMIRSFMDLTPPYLETGWTAVTSGAPPASLQGLKVGVYVGITGRDRIGLSRLLREQGAAASVVRSQEDLVAGLEAGTFDAGITEALVGAYLAAQHDWQVAWLPGEVHDRIGFGLWKGDLTLKREIVRILDQLRADGTTERLIERYIHPVTQTIGAREG